jgi:chromosome segregation ATPase
LFAFSSISGLCPLTLILAAHNLSALKESSEKEIQQLTTNAQDLEEKLKEAQESLKKTTAELQSKSNAYNAVQIELCAAKIKVNGHKPEMEEKANKILLLEEKLANALLAVGDTSKNHEALLRKNNEFMTQVKSLTKDVESKDKKIAQFENLSKTTKKELDMLKTNAENRIVKVGELEAKLAVKSKEVEDLNKETASKNESLTTLGKELTEAKGMLDNMKNSELSIKADLTNSEEALSKSNQEVGNLRFQLMENSNMLQNTQKELQESLKIKKEQDTLISHLKRSSQVMTNDLKISKDEIEDLNANKNLAHKEGNLLQEELVATKEKLKNAEMNLL